MTCHGQLPAKYMAHIKKGQLHYVVVLFTFIFLIILLILLL